MNACRKMIRGNPLSTTFPLKIGFSPLESLWDYEKKMGKI